MWLHEAARAVSERVQFLYIYTALLLLLRRLSAIEVGNLCGGVAALQISQRSEILSNVATRMLLPRFACTVRRHKDSLI